MIDRSTGGTPEERDKVIAQEPIGRMGRPEEIAATVEAVGTHRAKRRLYD